MTQGQALGPSVLKILRDIGILFAIAACMYFLAGYTRQSCVRITHERIGKEREIFSSDELEAQMNAAAVREMRAMGWLKTPKDQERSSEKTTNPNETNGK